MNDDNEVTTVERVVYSEQNGKPYTVRITVKRRCSENPEKELENFLRVCGRIADNVEKRLAAAAKEVQANE